LRSYDGDGRLDEHKLIFSAIANQPSSGELIVKFTPQYLEAAHSHLASHSLAPRVLKFIRISADWTAVVMEKSKYHLIDFDWAGPVGEAKYPLAVNCKTVKRPEGVRGCEFITKGLEMVSNLFAK